MARKRGGIAGIYDRNKGVIKALAPAALSFIPGVGIPLAAAAGAALGADRPGSKYFKGFDVGGAVRGGLTGAAIGAGTQGARALLTGGGPMAGMMGRGAASAAQAAPANPIDAVARSGAGFSGMTSTPLSAAGGAGGGGGASLLSRAGTFARENKDLIAMAGKGIQGAMPQPGQEAAMMNAETQRMLAEEQMAEAERERERRRRIAELLMPYAQGVYGSMNSRMNG